MTQFDDEPERGKADWVPSKRQAIRSRRVSTLSPALSRSIICSRVNPACCPAMASFLIAVTKAALAISPILPTKLSASSQVYFLLVCDLNHSLLVSVRGLPRRLTLLWFPVARMSIKFTEQVLLSTSSIMSISGWSKEFALAVRAACHYWNFAFISQNDEAALCHGTQCGTVEAASPLGISLYRACTRLRLLRCPIPEDALPYLWMLWRRFGRFTDTENRFGDRTQENVVRG